MKRQSFILILGIIVLAFLFFVGFYNNRHKNQANLSFQTKPVPIQGKDVNIQMKEINPEDLGGKIDIKNLKKENNTSSTTTSPLDNFAKCLSEKGVELYVLKTCPHCAHQKEMFGESLKYLKYIECSENYDLCIQKGIEAVPTWILPNGERLLGVQPLEVLSQKTGCKLK
jgi:glutaredoxin